MAKNLTPDLTEELWRAIELHLPARPTHDPPSGRPRADDKAPLRGLL